MKIIPQSIKPFEKTHLNCFSIQELARQTVYRSLLPFDSNRVFYCIPILVYLFIKRLCGTSNISPNHVQVVLLYRTDIILFVDLLTCHDWLTLLWELEDVPCQAHEWTGKIYGPVLYFTHVR